MDNLGLYIHAPFCSYKCPYCDFYSIRPDESTVKDYTDSVINEIKKYALQTNKKVDTLYFGGGTPTLMEREIIRITDAVVKYFKTDLKEVTIEANPKAQLYDLLKDYAENGINRISFGGQSANKNELKALARNHSREDIVRSVEDSVRAGIDNISLDMMIGIPTQTKESLNETISFYSQLPIQHISGYMLKIESGTPFAKIESKLDLPNDDAVSELYLQMVSELESYGFLQYEISNFAKAGFEAIHNTKYWTLDEYIGIGASAHSFFDGKRFYYPLSAKDFIENPTTVFDDEGGSDFEKVMLGLRLLKGFDISNLSEKSVELLKENCKKVPSGYIEFNENKIILTKQGLLVSNAVISTLTEGIE